MGDVIPGIRQHGFVGDVLPGLVKYLLLFEFENLLGEIVLGGKRKRSRGVCR
jgi:hypothetical protein